MFARAHPLAATAAFGVWAEAIDPLLHRSKTATSGHPTKITKLEAKSVVFDAMWVLWLERQSAASIPPPALEA